MGIVVRDYVRDVVSSLRDENLGSVKTPEATFVCVGDVIDTENEETYLRGHGTNMVNDKLVASVCGVVQRVNKLILVRPLKERYTASQGDVVVGRVTEVAGKRWKVNLNSQHEAALLLSAVNLPGGIQRRRTAEDELNMRALFREGDLVSAEVQSVHANDKSINLHTRSTKYGKLEGGQLVVVPPNLVKRQKQHFHHLQEIGVDLILGCNGLLWVAPHVELPPAEAGASGADDGTAGSRRPAPSREQRERAVRVAAAIRALERLYQPIYPATILETYQLSLSNGVEVRDMGEAPFLSALARSEAERRTAF